MNKKLTVLCLIVFSFALVSCSSVPINNQIVAATEALQAIVMEIDHAQAAGKISSEKEGKLLDQAQEINNQLRLAESLLDSCDSDTDSPLCVSGKDKLGTINQLLAKIELQLRGDEL